METWERLQARLFHLSYLGEELAQVAATSPAHSAWLYRAIAAEAGQVATIAQQYVAACEAECCKRHDEGGGVL